MRWREPFFIFSSPFDMTNNLSFSSLFLPPSPSFFVRKSFWCPPFQASALGGGEKFFGSRVDPIIISHEEEEEKYCRINKNLRENCTRQIWRRCCFVLFFRQTSWQTKQRFPPSFNIQGPLLMFIAMQGGDFGERKTRIVINHFFSRYDTIRENTRNGSFPPWRVYWTRKRIPPLPSSLPPPFLGTEWWILPPFPSYGSILSFFFRIASQGKRYILDTFFAQKINMISLILWGEISAIFPPFLPGESGHATMHKRMTLFRK